MSKAGKNERARHAVMERMRRYLVLLGIGPARSGAGAAAGTSTFEIPCSIFCGSTSFGSVFCGELVGERSCS